MGKRYRRIDGYSQTLDWRHVQDAHCASRIFSLLVGLFFSLFFRFSANQMSSWNIQLSVAEQTGVGPGRGGADVEKRR